MDLLYDVRVKIPFNMIDEMFVYLDDPVRPLTVDFLSGTAAVSNLGLIRPDWVDGADFAVREMWFSPPGVGTGVGIGTVSVGDRLYVALRFSPAVFSRDAAAAFADGLHAEFDLLCGA